MSSSRIHTRLPHWKMGATATEGTYYTINTGAIAANPASLTTTYPNNNVNPPYNINPTSNTTATSLKMYKLNGASGDKTGLGITLRVMSGDQVAVLAKSFWHSSGTNPTNSYNIVVNDLLTAPLPVQLLPPAKWPASWVMSR